MNGNVGNVNLNMRASASLGARVVRTLPRGQNLTILRSVNGATYRTPNGQTRSDWYEVQVGNQRGYVAGYYVSQGHTQVQSRPGHVNGNVGNVNLNMRASASLGARVVRTLPRGQNLTILRSVNGATYRIPNGQTRSDWYEVEVGGQRGYVAAYYVSQGRRNPTPPPQSGSSSPPNSTVGSVLQESSSILYWRQYLCPVNVWF